MPTIVGRWPSWDCLVVRQRTKPLLADSNNESAALIDELRDDGWFLLVLLLYLSL
jgi:hypothetical protein